MTDRHKANAISFRLPESDREWLRQHAARTGKPVNAIIARLVTEYRAAETNPVRLTYRAKLLLAVRNTCACGDCKDDVANLLGGPDD